MNRHMISNSLVLLIIFFVSGAGSALAVGPYVDNGDGTVTDSATGLMWQKSDDGEWKTWAEALEYCEGLSLAEHDDWRLPDMKELASIMKFDDHESGSLYMDPVFESKNQNPYGFYIYWSSTARATHPSCAWTINFSGVPEFSDDGKTLRRLTRCVRLGIPRGILTVNFAGDGRGSVTSTPAGVDCDANCTGAFQLYTAVSLTAVPEEGSKFAGWNGDCNASGQVVMDGDKSCQATFVKTAIPGDVSGDGTVNIVDALLVARCAVNLSNSCNKDTADVNCDDNVNIVDALLIARKSVGLPTPNWCI